MEALVLKDAWRSLFTDQELEIARQRLETLTAPKFRASRERDLHHGHTSHPQATDEKGNAARTMLETLERALRKYIEMKLFALTPNWWLDRIPPEVRRRAEDRRRRDETLWPWMRPSSATFTEFLDFSDYKKIIADERNWDQAFRSDFANREIIAGKFMELEPIRNTIAHHRDLSTEQLEVLQINAKHIMTLIKAR